MMSSEIGQGDSLGCWGTSSRSDSSEVDIGDDFKVDVPAVEAERHLIWCREQEQER